MDTSELLASLPLFVLVGLRTFATSVHLFTPRWASRFIAMDVSGTGGIVYARMFAIRNLFLLLGLLSLDSFSDPKVFLAVNVIIDAVDAVAFFIAAEREDISKKAAIAGIRIAAAATTFGALALFFHPL